MSGFLNAVEFMKENSNHIDYHLSSTDKVPIVYKYVFSVSDFIGNYKKSRFTKFKRYIIFR
jgi:hypothetical protein